MRKTTVAYVGNTNILEIRGLKSAIEDAFIEDADVAVTVKTEAGEAVDLDPEDSIWPLTMDYVAESDGDYRGIIPHDLPFVADRTYVAHIDADAGGERIGHWEFRFIPKTRRDV